MEKYQFPKIKDEIQFENFIRDLLNLIYQGNSFQLYGRKGQAQDGLDGYSTIHPIFFQCKHKSSPHVKDKKLEEELETELNKAKPKIEEVSSSTESKFLFFTTHPNTTKLQDKARVLSTDNIIVEYWGWGTIESHLNNLYISKYREFFSKYYPELAKILTTSKISPQLTTKLGESTLIGREKELQDINEQLKASKTLLVKGIGGMGKSTIASNYLHRHKDEYDYYGFFERLESFESQLELAFKLEIEQGQDKLDRVLRELIKLEPESNKLLVIDDVKEIKENQEKLEKILELKHNGYRVLLTSRFKVKNVEIYPLPTLNQLDAQKLFLDNYKTEALEKVNQIIEYLDYHPLFVELVAKTIKNEDYSLDDIIEKFELGELAKIKFINEEEGDEVSFNQNLKVLFEIQKDSLQDEYLLLLKQLAILPSIDIELSFLEEIFNRRLKSRLNFLVAQGWLIESVDGYKLHQVVKEYILTNYTPIFQIIEQILDFFIHLLNTTKLENAIKNKSYLIYLDHFCNYLDKENYMYEKVGIFYSRLSRLHIQLKDNKNVEKILMNASKISKIFKNNDELQMIYFQLGAFYKSIGQLEDALSYLKKDLEISISLYGLYHPDVARTYTEIGLLYLKVKDRDETLKFLDKALEIWEIIKPTNYKEISIAYNNLGEYFSLNEDYQRALSFANEALNLSIKIYGENHIELPVLYNNIGLYYWNLKNYKESLSNHNKSLRIRLDNLGEHHLDTAQSYNNIGLIHMELNEYEEALNYFKRDMEICKGILGEYHQDMGISYANMGIVTLKIGEIVKAKELLKKAISLLEQYYPENDKTLLSLKKSLKKC